MSYWMDVEMIRTPGHIKYAVGDNGTLMVQMRRAKKVFIIESWRWERPTFRKTHIQRRYARTKLQADKIFKEVYDEF